MYWGLFAAAITGAGMPLFALIMGQVFNTFTDNPTLDDIFNQLTFLSYLQLGIGLVIWIASFFYWSLLLTFSERAVRRIRIEYL